MLHNNPQVTFYRENIFYAINKYKYNEQEVVHCRKKNRSSDYLLLII